MKKVIVIGCPGSGKTTFAEKLQKCTGLPLYYLDAIWHKPDKTHIPREEFDERIKGIFKTSEWIIDGNYGRTIEMRLKECDTVFLFDLPTEICIQGATERIGKGRYDLPWLETELDPEFESFIKEFPETTLPKIYDLVEKYKAEKQVIIFKSREEADEYLRYKTMKFIDELKKNFKSSENTVIEPLKLEDYNKCSNIWNMKTQPLTEKWREEIASGNRLVFIYKINGEFIGEGALVLDTGDPDYTIQGKRIYVSRMIVKKEYRNRGIGSEILAFLIDKAKKMGFSEMTIGVDKDNVNALYLYRKFGFTEVLFDGADEDGEYFKLMKRI